MLWRINSRRKKYEINNPLFRSAKVDSHAKDSRFFCLSSRNLLKRKWQTTFASR